jgi:hypothetical protein
VTPSRDSLSRSIASHLGHGAPRVVWTDAGDEVLVHLDALQASRRDGVLVVRVDLEADEIGRERVTLAFALGEDASNQLVATTSETVLGGPLAARWGAILQDAIVDALASLRRDRRGRGVATLDSIVVRRRARIRRDARK